MTQLWKNGDSLTLGKYWLNSNLWGAETGRGSQCLWETSREDATVAWGTSWDWSGPAGYHGIHGGNQRGHLIGACFRHS